MVSKKDDALRKAIEKCNGKGTKNLKKCLHDAGFKIERIGPLESNHSKFESKELRDIKKIIKKLRKLR